MKNTLLNCKTYSGSKVPELTTGSYSKLLFYKIVHHISFVMFHRSETSFGKDNVRLFVYRDHDLKGRKLLFDSKSMCRLGETQVITLNQNKIF